MRIIVNERDFDHAIGGNPQSKATKAADPEWMTGCVSTGIKCLTSFSKDYDSCRNSQTNGDAMRIHIGEFVAYAVASLTRRDRRWRPVEAATDPRKSERLIRLKSQRAFVILPAVVMKN